MIRASRIRSITALRSQLAAMAKHDPRRAVVQAQLQKLVTAQLRAENRNDRRSVPLSELLNAG